MEQQTLKWLESIPKHKRNLKNMVMVFGENGIPKFIPKHLLKNGCEHKGSCDTQGTSRRFLCT